MPSAITSSKNTAHPRNVLLLKDPVGQRKPTVYDLPPHDHVYGIRVERNKDEGAAQVLNSWHVVQKSKETEPGLDYIAMNRNSAKAGLTNPKAQAHWRSDHPIRRKVINREAPRARTHSEELPSHNNLAFTYGMPTRPSTPVARLMTDCYQQEWLAAQSKRDAETLREKKEKAQQHKRRQNQAVNHQRQNHEQAQQQKHADQDHTHLFKLSKFQKVGAKINSHRPVDDPALIKYKQQPQTQEQKKVEQAVNAAETALVAATEKPMKKLQIVEPHEVANKHHH